MPAVEGRASDNARDIPAAGGTVDVTGGTGGAGATGIAARAYSFPVKTQPVEVIAARG